MNQIILENKNFHNYERRLKLLLSRINPQKYGYTKSIKGESKRKLFNLTKNQNDTLKIIK